MQWYKLNSLVVLLQSSLLWVSEPHPYSGARGGMDIIHVCLPKDVEFYVPWTRFYQRHCKCNGMYWSAPGYAAMYTQPVLFIVTCMKSVQIVFSFPSSDFNTVDYQAILKKMNRWKNAALILLVSLPGIICRIDLCDDYPSPDPCRPGGLYDPLLQR